MLPVGFKTVEEHPEFVKMLLYGQPGSGKTKFCADAPKPWWIDFENSTETLRHWPEYRDIPVKKPTGGLDLFKAIKAAVSDPSCETIIIDSVTTALDSFMMDQAEEIAKKNSNRDEFVFYEADYKYSTRVFARVFDVLAKVPINVVVIFHATETRDSEGRVTGIFPDVTPRLRQSVQRLVNVVAYLDLETSVKGNTRNLYVNRTKIIEAKNRLNIQEISLKNPEWKELYGH